ncbi:MAG: C25 family cysteine peptidase, partial [candidate division WOR-3 bacterium]
MNILFAQGPYTLTFDLSQFEFSVENGFDRVKGMEMSATTDTGAPELPVKTLNFILPNGTKVQNIEILSLTLIPVQGTYNIYPTQPPFPLTYPPEPPPWVPPDSLIYSTDALYPDSIPIQVSHRGSFDGIPMATIAVYPLLYNPVRDSLYLVQSITFRFLLENVPISQRPLVRGEGIHQLYLSGLRTSVYNQWEVDAFYSPPYQIVPDDEIGRLGYPEVIIVAPPACTLAYRPFANWLIEKGMFTAIVATDWIYLNYDGIWDPIPGYPGEYIGDDAAKIKEYLRKMYLECGTAFAILGGAPQFIFPENYFPCRYDWGGAPGDLYFQDFTGEWMNNPDYHEEIWIGRVPAWNYDQVLSWVEKRLTYEKSPVNKNLMVHSLWICQASYGGYDFEERMEEVKQYFPNYFVQHQIVDFPSTPQDHGLIDTLSKGYGIGSHYGHGAPDGIRTRTVGYNAQKYLVESFEHDNWPSLDELDNVNKYYVFYSAGCATADFDNLGPHGWSCWDPTDPLPCFAEAFTSFYRLSMPPDERPAIGAVAYIGNTRDAYWSESQFTHEGFIKNLFQNPVGYIIGIAEAKSKYSYGWIGWYQTFINNLFGSPEMPVWTENPKDMIVEHPDAIPANTQVNFVVKVCEYGPQPDPYPPLPNALVTLYKPGATLPEVYESEMTNADGIAYFSLNVPSTGVMKVTVTKHNYIPYQGDVQIFEFDVDIPTSHTQYTEGRKLVRQPNTENLNLSFTTLEFPGVNGPDAWSAYSLSTDGGSSWAQTQNVAQFTYNPSIGLTTEPNPRPCLAFRNSYEVWQIHPPAVIYFARYDEPNWTVVMVDSYPYGPPPFQPRVSPPAIRIDANNICHMVYSGVLYAPGKAYVVYKRFDVFNPGTETIIIDSATVPEDWEPSSPSIDLQYGYPHIVYDFPPEAGEPAAEIWYKCLTETGWTDPINISNSYNKPSLHPFIYLTNEKAIVVWSEEETPGNTQSREIYKAERFLNQPPQNWTKWKEIETPNQCSDWPVITANNNILVWNEHQFIDGKQNWEVLYHSDLYGDGNLSNTPYTQSVWASCDWRQTLTGIYLYSAFTEEYESEDNPYIFGIKTLQKSLQYIPIPLYTIYAGSETPSPYLVQRDGYIAYENYPVDYDTTELIYKFTGLNPDLKYRLDITAYHESEGEWREWVKIDNTAQHLIKYDAGVPKTVELPVPPASYMNDGEIVMKITKIRGEFAMCHKGNLYEFEEEQEGGGPQMIMNMPLNLEFG